MEEEQKRMRTKRIGRIIHLSALVVIGLDGLHQLGEGVPVVRVHLGGREGQGGDEELEML